MAEIYFIRHGESRANADRVIAGSLDSPLTKKGIDQAHEVAEMILASGIGFDVIISSPLSRAHTTAKIVAETLQYPVGEIILIDELQEKGAGDFESGAIGALYAADDEEMRRAGAESYADFALRVKRLNSAIKEYATGTTLIVGHSGIYRMAQCVLQNLPPADMKKMEKVANGKLMRYPI